MRKPKTLEETYDTCIAGGHVNDITEVNHDKIKSLLQNADICLGTATIVIKAISQKDKEWMSVYLNHYDALRIHAEAFLLFDKLDIPNHECLFACLCVKHPELEFDWEFLNNVRKKRNGVNYYGDHINYDNWRSAELQFKLYISTLKKEINKKLVVNPE